MTRSAIAAILVLIGVGASAAQPSAGGKAKKPATQPKADGSGSAGGALPPPAVVGGSAGGGQPSANGVTQPPTNAGQPTTNGAIPPAGASPPAGETGKAPPQCVNVSPSAKEGDKFTPPPDYQVDHFETGAPGSVTTPDVATILSDQKWTSQAAELAKANAGLRVILKKNTPPNDLCIATVNSPLPSQTHGGSAADPGGSYDECERQGQAWERDISSQAPRHTLIVFSESGAICHANRLYGVQGDPIYIGLYTEQSRQWKQIEFSPCSLEDAAPAIFVGAGTVSLAASGTQTGTYGVMRGYPRLCYNDSVDIKTDSVDGSFHISFTLPQYHLYRATLQLGVLYTDQHISDFGLATDSAGNTVIHNSATHGRGPEYVASLVVYGLPHYLSSLTGGPAYEGRDLIHQQTLEDRIGLVLGVGLTDPTRRFVVGASFEIMYGINLFAVEDILRQRELDGFQEGSAFSGDASTIPTHELWRNKLVFGVSVDLRYVQEIFSGKIHQ